jgi:predicted MFS family arabinose efflux permease
MSTWASSWRIHYAWVVIGLMFAVVLSTVGVRAAPSVLIVPLEQAFGWSRATISAAISLNILVFGLIGPFAAALIQTLGLKRTVLAALGLLSLTMVLSTQISAAWQMFAVWGLLVGIGSGAGTVGLGAAVANRWFVAHRGLALGLLTASNASGQLVFLPLLAAVAEQRWQNVSWILAAVMLALIPITAMLLPEDPASINLAPLGASPERLPPPSSGNPVAVAFNGLARGMRSADFWLLFASFGICGFSTNGLVGTHLIAYCIDHGIAEVAAASFLAAIGVFDLIGTTLSGWLTDKFNPRYLLFWYYSLRGLALMALPFTHFDVVSLSIFAIFYGLDWVATVPPTVTLTNQVFGRHAAPVIVAWIVAGHQLGAAIAALGAGSIRIATGSYFEAFVASGFACLIASLLVLRIARAPVTAPA